MKQQYFTTLIQRSIAQKIASCGAAHPVKIAAALRYLRKWPNWQDPVLIIDTPSLYPYLVDFWAKNTQATAIDPLLRESKSNFLTRLDAMGPNFFIHDLEQLLLESTHPHIQTHLFHLINHVMQPNSAQGQKLFLMIGITDTGLIQTLQLKDLRSRIRRFNTISITEEHHDITEILAIFFEEYQLKVSKNHLTTIASKIPRTPAAARQFVLLAHQHINVHKCRLPRPCLQTLIQQMPDSHP